LRLVKLRRKLEANQTEALDRVLKRKRDDLRPLDELPLGPEILADLHTILEQDSWEGNPSGRDWLQDWLQNGVDWARNLEELAGSQLQEEYYCQACWKACYDDRDMQKHRVSKDHRKRQRTWEWRYGALNDNLDSEQLGGAPASPGDRETEKDKDTATFETKGASKAAAEILRKAARIRESPVAAAKRRLLEYRNALTVEQRQEIIRRIGLPRANDVKDLKALQSHFDAPLAESLSQVAKERGEDREDMDWICREPTFSWLSGFYWHPDATSLEQQGDPHSAHFCHLCEADAWTEDAYRQHLVTRRHAENALRWAEQMGDLAHPLHCGRCPGAASSSSSSSSGSRAACWAENKWRFAEDGELDLDHRRDPALPDPEVKPETKTPYGFEGVYEGDRGSVQAVPYVAVAVKVDRRVCAVRLVSKLQIGPKEKTEKHQGRREEKRWYIEFFWCLFSKTWKTLAMPMTQAKTGEQLNFTVSVQWEQGEKAPWEELDEPLSVQVPVAGVVAVLNADLAQSGVPVWVEQKEILKFVGKGQVDAAGGIREMRGMQRPMQFATEDTLLSFLFWVPEADEPAPLMVFFHGDMPRGVANCPQPGLADFVPTYGPALHVVDGKKYSHPVRSFVVCTPCCADEVWWLRHPAMHDAQSYAESVERCLRGMIELTYDLGVCRHESGACFAGQSMGAYMALELARAMPEGTASVFAGAPCFDAFRLSHLAERLINVPVWLLIGRNDTMCSFEEVASLALKMRDLDAKCIRLTSVGIKGHSEVGKKLEKHALYEWLRNPLG